jgi:chromatin remodeling complex protein RSC6
MQASEVTVSRKKNLGNYEYIESSVTIAMVEGDSPDKAVDEAKRVISLALGESRTTAKAQVKTTTNAKAPVKEEPVKEEKPEEAPSKKTSKKATKKASTRKAAPKKEEVVAALREYAKAKGTKEMAIAVLEDVTGKESLGEVPAKDYAKLIRALKV